MPKRDVPHIGKISISCDSVMYRPGCLIQSAAENRDRVVPDPGNLVNPSRIFGNFFKVLIEIFELQEWLTTNWKAYFE